MFNKIIINLILHSLIINTVIAREGTNMSHKAQSLIQHKTFEILNKQHVRFSQIWNKQQNILKFVTKKNDKLFLKNKLSKVNKKINFTINKRGELAFQNKEGLKVRLSYYRFGSNFLDIYINNKHIQYDSNKSAKHNYLKIKKFIKSNFSKKVSITKMIENIILPQSNALVVLLSTLVIATAVTVVVALIGLEKYSKSEDLNNEIENAYKNILNNCKKHISNKSFLNSLSDITLVSKLSAKYKNTISDALGDSNCNQYKVRSTLKSTCEKLYECISERHKLKDVEGPANFYKQNAYEEIQNVPYNQSH